MSHDTWIYPKELAAVLPLFGLKPTPHTPPLLVRTALNDLYRYEIRCLRQRLFAGQVAKADYFDCVVALRKKYWPLTLQPEHWERIVTRSVPAPTAARS